MLDFFKRITLNFFVLFSLYIVQNYVSIIFSIFILILYIIHGHILYVDNNKKTSDTIDDIRFEHNLDLNNVLIVKTEQKFGEAVSRIRGKNIIKIPRECVNTDDFLFVLYHEYYHITNNHKYKYDLIRFLSLVSVFLFTTILATKYTILLFAILSPIIVLILNIYRHKIEHMADRFSADKIPKRYIVERIRKHPNNNIYRDFRKYIYPYPPTRERLQNQID